MSFTNEIKGQSPLQPKPIAPKKPIEEILDPAIKYYEDWDIQDAQQIKNLSELDKEIPPNLTNIFFEDPKLFVNIHLGAVSKASQSVCANETHNIKYLKYLLSYLKGNGGLEPEPGFLDKLIKKIEQLEIFQKKLTDLQNLKPDPQNQDLIQPHLEQALDNLTLETAQAIDQLAIGESYLLCGGWSNDPAGHTVYYQFRKIDQDHFDIMLYELNPSDKETIGGDMEKKKTPPVVYYQAVPREKVFFTREDNLSCSDHQLSFIRRILSLNAYPIWNFKQQYNPFRYDNREFENCFAHLKAHKRPPPPLLNHFMTLQRGVNCTWRSLNGLLLGLVGDSLSPENQNLETVVNYYKYLMFQSKHLSLIAMQKSCNTVDFPEGKKAAIKIQLEQAAENTCRRAYKVAKKNNPFISRDLLVGSLCTARDFQARQTNDNQFAAAILKSNSQNVKVRARKLDTIITDIRNDIPKVEGDIVKTPDVPSLIIEPLSENSTVEEFANFIRDHTKTITQLKDYELVEYVGAVVGAIPLPLQKSEFWKRIGSLSEKDKTKLLISLSLISDFFATVVFKLYPNERVASGEFVKALSNTHCTQVALTVMIFELSKPPGENISLDGTAFLDRLKCTVEYTVRTQRERTRRDELISYFKEQKKDALKLFNFTQYKSFHSFKNTDDFKLNCKIIAEEETLQKSLDKEIHSLGNQEDFPGLSLPEKRAVLLATRLSMFAYKKYSNLMLAKRCQLLTYLMYNGEVQGSYQNNTPLTIEIKNGQFNFKYLFFNISGLNRLYKWESEDQYNESQDLEGILSENNCLISRYNPLSREMSEPGVQCASILYYLQENMEILSKFENRKKIMHLLLRQYIDTEGEEHLALRDEIKKKESGFWDLCRNVIQSGLNRYYFGEKGKQLDFDVIFFFFELEQILTQFQIEIHGEIPKGPPLIPDKIELLKSLIKNENSFYKLKRNISILEHYMCRNAQEFTKEEWSTIWVEWFSLDKKEIFYAPTGIHLQVAKIQRRIQEVYRDFIQACQMDSKTAEYVCDEIIKSQHSVAQLEKGEWRKGPDFEFEKSGSDLWKLDFANARISNRNGWLHKSSLKDNQFFSDFRRIFKKDSKMAFIGSTAEFDDKIYGHVRIINGDCINGVQCNFNGARYYQLMPYKKIETVLPHGLVSNYSHWVPVDPNDGNEILIVELLTGKTSKLNINQRFHSKLQEVEGVDSLGSGIDIGAKLGNFDTADYTLLFLQQGKEKVLQYPRFHRHDSVEPLTFTRDDQDRWIYNYDPEYMLISHPAVKGPLGHCFQSLYLQHKTKKDHYKILMPMNPIETNKDEYSKTVTFKASDTSLDFPQKFLFTEIDFKEGDLSSDTLLGTLSACYQSLLQKEYKQAFVQLQRVIDKVSTSEPFADNADKILLSIINLEGSTDTTPNACAVRMHASLLYKKLKRIKECNLPFEVSESYIMGLNQVDFDLRLSYEQLQELKNNFGNNLIRFRSDDNTTLYELQNYIKFKNYYYTDDINQKTTYVSPALYYHYENVKAGFRYNYEFLSNSKIEPLNKFGLIYEINQYPIIDHRYKIAFYLAYHYPDEVPVLPKEDATEEEIKDFWAEIEKIYKKYCPEYTKSGAREIKEEARPTPTIQSHFTIQTKTNSLNTGQIDPLELIEHAYDFKLEMLKAKYLPDLQDQTILERAGVHLGIPDEKLNKEELKYLDAIHQEFDIYNRDYAKGRILNDKEKEATPLLLNRKMCEYMLTDSRKLENESVIECKKFEQLIEKMIKQKPHITEDSHWLSHALRGGHAVINPPLTVILRAVAATNEKESLEALQELNKDLSDDEARRIRALVIVYMQKKTELDQIRKMAAELDNILKALNNKASLDSVEVQSAWHSVCTMASQDRQYDPFQKPKALLFEYLSGLRVRMDQADLIEAVVTNILSTAPNKSGIVFQRMMGGGKTTVILSSLIDLASENGIVPLFLCHYSQYSSVLGNLKQFQKERFNKDLIDIDYTKQQIAAPEVLELIKGLLENARKNKQPIIMKTTMLQMLELEYLNVGVEFANCNDPKDSASLKQRLDYLNDILEFIHDKKKCLGVFDEVDLNLNTMQGVHFALGEEKSVDSAHILLIKEMYQIMATEPVLNGILKLTENRQAEISVHTYNQEVLPLLAKALSKKRLPLKLKTPDLKKSFVRYVTGKIPAVIGEYALGAKTKPEKLTEEDLKDIEFMTYLHVTLAKSKSEADQEAAALISLSKQILLEVFNVTLTKSCNRSYGRTHVQGIDPQKPGEVVPYMGVGTPARTKFGYIYEHICYHFQTALNIGISSEQVLSLSNEMYEAARFFSQRSDDGTKKQLITQTPEAEQFFELTGVQIDEINQPGKLEIAVKTVNSSIEKRLRFEAATAQLLVSYHSEVLSSTSVDVVDQLPNNNIACSGTTWNVPTFNQDLQHVIPDEGTEGRIIDALIERHKEGRTRILTTQSNDIQSLVINQIANHPHKERVRGFIDVGGLLKRYSNVEVAETILKNHNVKAVVYLYQNEKTGKESFVLQTDKKKFHLKNTTEKEIAKCGIPLDQIFYYFDDLRTTGTDFPQAADSINLMTLDLASTPIRNIAQGALRARKFLLGQDIDIIYIGEKLPLENIISICVKNQAILKAKQVFRSYLDQINGFMRREIMQLLRNTEKENPARFKELLLIFKPFLFKVIKDDPYSQYSEIEEEMVSFQVIEAFKKERLQLFLKLAYSVPELDALQLDEREGVQRSAIQRVDESLKKLMEKAVKDPSLKVKMMSAAFKSASEKTVEIYKEQEKQKEKKSELTQELQAEFDEYNKIDTAEVIQETLWKQKGASRIGDSFSLDNFVGCETLSLCDSLRRYSAYKEDYATCFPDNIIVTGNFSLTTKHILPIFHYTQKQGHQVLVYLDEGKIKFLLLSKKETVFFRNWIHEYHPNNAWLMNPDGILLESSPGVTPLPADPEFLQKMKEGLWHVNFLNGNAKYLSSQEDLSLKLLSTGNNKVKIRFLGVRCLRSPTQAMIFDQEPIFHLFDVGLKGRKVQVIQFENRANAFMQKYVRTLSDAALKDLDVMHLPYVSPDRVKFLSDDNLKRLRKADQILGIPLEKIDLISKKQWKILVDTKEKLSAAGINLIHNLPIQKLELLSLELVPYYSAAQVAQLKTLKYLKTLAVEQIKYLTLPQLKFISESHESDLKKKVVENLSDEQIGTLSNPQIELLELLSDVQLLKLKEGVLDLLSDVRIKQINESAVLLSLSDRKIPLIELSKLNFAEFAASDRVAALSIKQISDLTEQHQIIIANLRPSQIQHLKNENLKFLSMDEKVLKAVEENRLHHLTSQQINARQSFNKPGMMGLERFVGLIRTILIPLEFVLASLINLLILCAYLLGKNSTQWKRQVKKTFMVDPLLCFYRWKQLTNPVGYIQKCSEIKNRL